MCVRGGVVLACRAHGHLGKAAPLGADCHPSPLGMLLSERMNFSGLPDQRRALQTYTNNASAHIPMGDLDSKGLNASGLRICGACAQSTTAAAVLAQRRLPQHRASSSRQQRTAYIQCMGLGWRKLPGPVTTPAGKKVNRRAYVEPSKCLVCCL